MKCIQYLGTYFLFEFRHTRIHVQTERKHKQKKKKMFLIKIIEYLFDLFGCNIIMVLVAVDL